MYSKTLFNLLLLAATNLAIVSSQQQIDPIKKTLIDTLVERDFFLANHIPGLALAIYADEGQTKYALGYGFLDLENGVEAKDDTIFGIGSISKSFTSVIVARTLAKLFPQYSEKVLDIPIRNLLPPGEKFILGDRFRSENSNFRDLLSHRTCLNPKSLALAAGFNKSQLIYRQRYAPEVCPFRTNMVYNNIIVAQAGELIASIANQTFDSMMMEFFQDLGMNDTTIFRDTDDYDNMPTLSKPYYYRDGTLRRFNQSLLKKVSFAPGSGGIVSSARDMLRYLEFHLNLGKIDGEEIVPETTMKWLHKVGIHLPFGDGKKQEGDRIRGPVGYALGLAIVIYDGWVTYEHGGYFAPYFSQMTIFPELKLGIFSSSSGPGFFPDETDHVNFLHPKIYDILRGTKTYKKRVTRNQTKSDDKVKDRLNTNFNMQEMPGIYGNPQSGELEVIFRGENNGYYLTYGVWATDI